MPRRPSASSPPVSRPGNTLRQLKLVIPGAAITYYLDTYKELLLIAYGRSGWGRTFTFTSLALGLNTIAMFLCMLAIPMLKGNDVDYHRWRESKLLSSIVPILTASIVVGWSLLVLTLGQFSRLGYMEGFIGAGGLYLFAFGLMGLIPVPRPRRP